jgi:hypothetical protein
LVTVHWSGTDAFSRQKTDNIHGRDKTPKRRLSVKMGLSPRLPVNGNLVIDTERHKVDVGEFVAGAEVEQQEALSVTGMAL